MPHEVPPLPYPYDCLEPFIDEATMRIHHDRHHAAYAAKLNEALERTKLANFSAAELIADLGRVPDDVRNIVRNNAGGHHNHTLFWESMGPAQGGSPTGALAQAITSTFESFDAFKSTFETAGIDRFGSGWVWLVRRGGKLEILSTPNQDSPLSDGATPLVGNDVWEHAYYLKYQNRRAEYLRAWWSVVDWTQVAKRLAADEQGGGR